MIILISPLILSKFKWRNFDTSLYIQPVSIPVIKAIAEYMVERLDDFYDQK